MKHSKIELQVLSICAPPLILNSVFMGKVHLLADSLPHVQISFLADQCCASANASMIKLTAGQTDQEGFENRHCGMMSFGAYAPKQDTDFNGWLGGTLADDDDPVSRLCEVMAQDVFKTPPRLRMASLAARIHTMKQGDLAGILPDTVGRFDSQLQRLSTQCGEVSTEIWASTFGSDIRSDVISEALDWIAACFQETQWLNGGDLAEA